MKDFIENSLPPATIVARRPDLGPMPFVLLGDGGFKLTDYLMTPFTEASVNKEDSWRRLEYNKRLSGYSFG